MPVGQPHGEGALPPQAGLCGGGQRNTLATCGTNMELNETIKTTEKYNFNEGDDPSIRRSSLIRTPRIPDIVWQAGVRRGSLRL
ncbi:hypothetical protein JTB14_035489 [Gonioctena quinquepunctata]|nr:hypothetical protein JTB14_035489 [Gonioctena quinquepunctata]